MTRSTRTLDKIYRLTTLGGLSLAAEDGLVQCAAPSSAAQRRRCLALLALTAADRKSGVTAERVIGILWPECDTAHAVNNLKQTKHTLRDALGQDLFIVTGTSMRLNEAVLTADVWKFRELLTAGKLDDAAALYTGPFLDGFHLPGITTFEWWSESERERLRLLYIHSLGTLAGRAGNPGQAIHWWMELVALDPLNDHHAEGLIRALVHAGDVTAARQAARQHEERIAAEFEVSPPPQFRRLVADTVRKMSEANAAS